MSLLCFTVNFFQDTPNCLRVVYSMYSGIKAVSLSNQSRIKRRSGASLNRESPGEKRHSLASSSSRPVPGAHSFMQAIGYQL